MKKYLNLISSFFFILCTNAYSQDCNNLSVTYQAFESRCAATGEIHINTSNGSGTYNYRATGPVNTSYSSSGTVTGLPAGTYTITVKDVETGCIINVPGIVVPGTYSDPRFALTKTDITCLHANNGTISLSSVEYGRSPFTYTIVEPSIAGVGITNSTGFFNNLVPGNYYVQLKDSCGGIQTRSVTIQDYNWWINDYDAIKSGCNNASFSIEVKDSRGNANNGTGSSVFSAFTYAVVKAPGDTIWSNTYNNINISLDDFRSVGLVVKDGCGNIKTVNWTDTDVPSLPSVVTISGYSCNTVNAGISGTHLINPQYCLYDNTNTQIACNSSGSFPGIAYGTYSIRVTDVCYDTVITRTFTANKPVPSAGSANISNRGCNTFDVSISGQTNLFNPIYCLYDNSNTQVGACNSTGSFPGIPYGTYSIKITTTCYDTVITRTFAATNPKPSVAANVSISNIGCNTFDISISGQTNLFNPDYCLYDNNDNLISCNTTGSFTNVSASIPGYCMKITSPGCYDTTITRCFTAPPSVLYSVAADVSITNRTCTGFTASITGQTNFTSAQYCLYDNANTLIQCNTNGVFDDLPYGNYCITTTLTTGAGSCYDTTISRCFSASASPVIYAVDAIAVTDRTCTGFTASITGQTNFTSAQYYLYDSSNNLIASNTTGVFNNVYYGNFCIQTVLTAGVNSCYDTIISRCAVVTRITPSIDSAVSINNKTCSGFSATITGQQNLIDPQYCLYSGSTLVTCNTSGQFDNLPYGSYCIRVLNGCGDDPIERCFTVDPVPVAVTLSVRTSCGIDQAKIGVSVNTGIAPYRIEVYNPASMLVKNLTGITSSIDIDSLPALSPGQLYQVIVHDACNNSALATINPVATTLAKSISVTNKCPGGTTPDGSADVRLSLNSSLGKFYPKIIKKDGSTVNITYTTTISDTVFTFSDLIAATYVIESTIGSAYSGCGTKVYDTVTVQSYQFPSLQNSSLYQCDNNDFSVGAVVTGGIAPFQYEIIGSVPSTPSIISAPQNNPFFNINTGTTYSLVRLRTIDGCGNASINDVSVLPLANVFISTQNQCMYNNITLHVDTLPNATYTWYKKTGTTDSVEIGNSINYNIPFLMPEDTGVYICAVEVNDGCLKRTSYFTVDGDCGEVLAGENIKLSGKTADNVNQLSWITSDENNLKEYVAERKIEGASGFVPLATIALNGNSGINAKHLINDDRPWAGKNYYRIKIISKTGHISYSNIITIDNSNTGNILSVYPNPASDILYIRFGNYAQREMKLILTDASGRAVLEKTITTARNSITTLKRPANLAAGVYFLSFADNKTGIRVGYRIIFR